MPDLILKVFIWWVTNFRRRNVIIGSVSQSFSSRKYGQGKVLPSGFFFPRKRLLAKKEKNTLYDFVHIYSENVLKGPLLNRKIWQTCQLFLKSVQGESMSCHFYHRLRFFFFKKILEMIVTWIFHGKSRISTLRILLLPFNSYKLKNIHKKSTFEFLTFYF